MTSAQFSNKLHVHVLRAMGKDMCIVTVSVWDRFKIQFLSFVFGVWVVCKLFLKWIWDPKSFFILQERDNPPACLVDSFLGQHKYVKLKGVKLHYVESGAKHLPLVLLLHGFPDCWLSWRHQIPVLAQYFRVIALDLKGFGDSDKPSKRNTYRVDVILEELQQLISTLGVSSCTVVGHDIGALLGWCLVQQCPELVDRFVAVSSPHPNVYRQTLGSNSNYEWLNFVQLPYFPEVDALREDVKIISKYHRHLPPNDTYLEAYKYAFSRKEDWTGPLNYYRNLPYFQISEKTELVEVPTVLIVGNKDRFVSLESIVKSTDYCENFHVKIVDGTEHFPHQENPFKFNEILLKHLVRKRNSTVDKEIERSNSRGLMNMMFGAMSNTMKYGNSVLDSVQKKTNGVVGSIPAIGRLNYIGNDSKTDV